MSHPFGSDTIKLSNERFIGTIFAPVWDDDDAATVVTGFFGDPNVPRKLDPGSGKWRGDAVWSGSPADIDGFGAVDLPWMVRAGANNFFTISAFKPRWDDGRPADPARGLKKKPAGWRVRRIKAGFAAMPSLFLDDLGGGAGAKLDPSLVRLPPSWVLETSPDNFQVGYILDPAVTDITTAERLLKALVHQGLLSPVDTGMLGVTRYGRLPVGANAKAKYVKALGKPWRHVLRVWEPGRRYDINDLVNAYELNLDAVTVQTGYGSKTPIKIDASNDPYLPVLSDLGLVFSDVEDKGADGQWVQISCPWHEEHTDGVDNGAAYRVGGGFVCHHGSHRMTGANFGAKNFTDFREWLQQTHSVDTDVLDRQGLPNQMLPRERMGKLFRQHGDANPIPTYRQVIREYGQRGVLSVIHSAVHRGLSDSVIQWLVKQERPDDSPQEVQQAIAQARIDPLDIDL